MKLYTEEQVKEMLSMTDMIFENDLMPHVDIISCFKPIELPSDEEIEKLQDNNDNYDDYDFYDTGFKQGVKWMKEQILNQNNNMAEKIEHIVDPNKMITAVNWLISKQKHNKFFDIETIEEAREMEKYQIGQFLNWFIKHYSTTNIDGFFGWADSMDKEVTIADILAHYYNENPTQ